jgi:hypothetical protein
MRAKFGTPFWGQTTHDIDTPGVTAQCGKYRRVARGSQNSSSDATGPNMTNSCL